MTLSSSPGESKVQNAEQQIAQCFPAIAPGFVEDIARREFARVDEAFHKHGADGVYIDINDLAILAMAVLSVGASAWPDGLENAPSSPVP